MTNQYVQTLVGLSTPKVDYELCDENRARSNPSLLLAPRLGELCHYDEIVQNNPQKSLLEKSPKDFFKGYLSRPDFIETNVTIPQIVERLETAGYTRFVLTTQESITRGWINYANHDSRAKVGLIDSGLEPIVIKNGGLRKFYSLDWEAFRGLSSELEKLEFLENAGFTETYDAGKIVAKYYGRDKVLVEDFFSRKINDKVYAIRADTKVVLEFLLGPADVGLSFSFSGKPRYFLSDPRVGTELRDTRKIDRKVRRLL